MNKNQIIIVILLFSVFPAIGFGKFLIYYLFQKS